MWSQTKLPHARRHPRALAGELWLLTSHRGLLQSLERIHLLIKSTALEGKDVAADGDLQREAGEGAASQPCKPQDSPAAAGGKAWQRKSQSTGEALCTFARKVIPSHSRSPGTRGLALAPLTGQPACTAEVQTRVLEESSSIFKLFPSTISPKWRLCSVLVGAQHLAGASSSFSFPLSANMLGRREGKEGEKKKAASTQEKK